MAIAVIMPRQGQSVESCIITAWNKQKGDKVNVGELLFSYETDKSTFDEVAQESGVILDVFANVGDDVPCLETVCIIGSEGEDYSALIPKKEEKKTEAVVKTDAVAKDTQPVRSTAAQNAGERMKISPRAKYLALATDADLSKAIPTGPDGRVIEKDIQRLLDEGKTTTSLKNEEFIKNGMIIAANEESFGAYTDTKLPNIRKVIAKSMHASISEMAQLTHQTSFDATALMNLRKKIKAEGKYNITLNDMVLFAVMKTLKKPEHKDINAHFFGDFIRHYTSINLGIAVDTDRGLMVPTLFDSEKMTLEELSQNAKVIINEAQSGTINPDKLKGGTFTVTNLGTLGVEAFTPIINPPQTAILGVCNITYRVKKQDDEMVFYPAMGLSLTFDHRAVDGAPAARFLCDLVKELEAFDGK